jgi:hypothetical protein
MFFKHCEPITRDAMVEDAPPAIAWAVCYPYLLLESSVCDVKGRGTLQFLQDYREK